MATAKHKRGERSIDSILDTISMVPGATASQDLSWRLTTVDKLDRLGSHNPPAPANILTEPRLDDLMGGIMNILCHFKSPTDQGLQAKLTEITRNAIKLWSALRRDSCRVNFDYDPSNGGWQETKFTDDFATTDTAAAYPADNIPPSQLPSNSFMLFPRITGTFDAEDTSPRVLHPGWALSHDSPAFREALLETKRIEQEMKDFKLRLRRGSSAQSSPMLDKNLAWPAQSRGYN